MLLRFLHSASVFAVILASLTFLFLTAAFAGSNKMAPELVPPEVTLSGAESPAAAPPGTSASAASTSNTAAGGNAVTTNPGANNAAQGQLMSGGGNRQLVTPTAPSVQGTEANADNRPDPIAIIETDKGNITIELFRKYAPKTTANFIELAGKGFYNGLTFHRVEPGFCIQGGDPRGDGFGVYYEQGTKQPRILQLERSPYLKHNGPGVVAMANFPKNPNTASCQFYITLAAEPQLDGDYSIFGGVLPPGMDVVNKIVKGDKMNRVYVQERPQ